MHLHDYQKVAVEFLQGRDSAGLFLDMGLGKTAVTLCALEPRHLPALVVAPKRVAEEVWHVERDLWRPDLSLGRAVGGPAYRQGVLEAGYDITVISRDNLGDVRRMRTPAPFRTIILDELSSYKNRSSNRWKAAWQIVGRDTVQVVWGLTGTPIPNGYMNLFPQIGLLDGGERLGQSITRFRKTYFNETHQLANGHRMYEIKPGADKEIRALIEDICLSMETDGRIELPPLTINPVAVELPPVAARAYNDLRKTLVADLTEIYGEVHSASSEAVLTNKLTQITAGFIYSDDADINDGAYTPLHTEKLKALEEIVESAQGSGVLVFYRYVPEREMILQAISSARTIDEPHVIEQWNRGEVPVLVAHPASAGHGLNLQHGGHTQVWTSLDWDLELWEQGIKRTHRQGQKHPVVVHMLLANRTVDHRARKRLVEKADVQDELLDYLEAPI
jgi:SNF2 family DNA or RNA helicase